MHDLGPVLSRRRLGQQQILQSPMHNRLNISIKRLMKGIHSGGWIQSLWRSKYRRSRQSEFQHRRLTSLSPPGEMGQGRRGGNIDLAKWSTNSARRWNWDAETVARCTADRGWATPPIAGQSLGGTQVRGMSSLARAEAGMTATFGAEFCL